LQKIAVVILNYQGQLLLQEYLPSILAYLPDESEVYIADNGSTDSSISFLKEFHSEVKIIELERNYGFAGGYNRALSQINATYYVLINSDILVKQNWIQPIIEQLDSNQEIGACQPKINSIIEPNKFEYAGAGGGWIDLLGYPFCKGRIFDTVEIDNGQYDQIEEVFWASGAAMVIRAKAFHEVGGFDENFFAHMEEIDLCYRLKRMGYSVYTHCHVNVYHLGGGTLSYNSDRKIHLNFRNSLLMLLKNKSTLSAIFSIPLRMILDGIAGVKFLLEGKKSHFYAVIKAHLEFYTMIQPTLKLRRAFKIKIGKKKMNKSGIYRGSIVLQYYLLGVKMFQVLKTGRSIKI